MSPTPENLEGRGKMNAGKAVRSARRRNRFRRCTGMVEMEGETDDDGFAGNYIVGGTSFIGNTGRAVPNTRKINNTTNKRRLPPPPGGPLVKFHDARHTGTAARKAV